MRLTDHFKKAIEPEQQNQVIESKVDLEEVKAKINEYSNIFVDGTRENILKIHDDGSISYFGEIEFPERSYVDNTGKMPFKFKHVNRFVILKGYAAKLSSLEGSPRECHTFILDLEVHKPPSFFEGHFPKIANVIDISVTSLQHCKFGTEQIKDKFELSIKDEGDEGAVKSFEGLPKEINRVIINNAPTVIRSFKGFPEKVNEVYFYGYGGEFDVKDFAQFVHSVGIIGCTQSRLKENTPILSLFKLKYLEKLKNDNMIVDDCKNVFRIVNKYLEDGDVFGCQEELIDQGFDQYAKTK